MSQQWDPIGEAGDDDDWAPVEGGQSPPSGTEIQAVLNDRYDERDWEDARLLPGLREMVGRYDLQFDYARTVFKDLFWLLTKEAPIVRAAGEMQPQFVPARQLVDAFSRYPELANLRSHTVGEPYNAVMALQSMDTEIGQAFEAMRRAQLQAQELAKAVADGADAEEVAVLQAATEAVGTAAALDAMGKLRGAASAVDEEITADAELCRGFGVGPGVVQQMPHGQRRELMRRLRGNRLARFARLIGAFKAEAEAQWRKRSDAAPSEIAGVELGDDLTRLSGAEMINLAVPQLRIDWYRRYLEQTLLVHQLSGNDRQGRGPMVLVVDESGSMTSELGGVTREAWSKALCLGLADIAHRQKRRVTYIGYSAVSDQVQIDLRPGDVESVIEMTEHFFNGGTHFERPLDLALQVAVSEFTGEGQADIVFLTDDVHRGISSEFVAQFNAARRAASVAVHGILIGSEESGTMRQVCDTLRPITGVIAGGEVGAAAPIFTEMMK